MSKHILVLARRDVHEAMRVAAGLTIRNNTVDFIFMTAPIMTTHDTIADMEFLELAEIKPQSMIEINEKYHIPVCQDLKDMIEKADRVVSF